MLKTVLLILPLFTAGPSCFAGVAYAAVDLFDSKRGEVIDSENTPKKSPVAKVNSRAKILDLMFVGVSEIDSTTLYFKDKKNKQVKVQLKPETENALPGYPGLIIEKVENRVLYIKDRKMSYCKDNVPKGIYCQAGEGYIEMKLVRQHVAAPKTAKRQIKRSKVSSKAPAKVPKKKKQGITRIDPDDVPEGMRLIKSPFGDRLVPED